MSLHPLEATPEWGQTRTSGLWLLDTVLDLQKLQLPLGLSIQTSWKHAMKYSRNLITEMKNLAFVSQYHHLL